MCFWGFGVLGLGIEKVGGFWVRDWVGLMWGG